MCGVAGCCRVHMRAEHTSDAGSRCLMRTGRCARGPRARAPAATEGSRPATHARVLWSRGAAVNLRTHLEWLQRACMHARVRIAASSACHACMLPGARGAVQTERERALPVALHARGRRWERGAGACSNARLVPHAAARRVRTCLAPASSVIHLDDEALWSALVAGTHLKGG